MEGRDHFAVTLQFVRVGGLLHHGRSQLFLALGPIQSYGRLRDAKAVGQFIGLAEFVRIVTEKARDIRDASLG